MKRKKWEVELRKELTERLFRPRLERISAVLKGKSPKKIVPGHKRAILRSIKPLIRKAIGLRSKAELNSLKLKSFKLKHYRPGQRKDKIVEKIKKYEGHRGKKVSRLVYTLWNDRRECLYVGQTKRGLPEIVAKGDRLYRQSARLKLFFTNKKKLDRYEGIAYHVLAPRDGENPRYNKTHPANARKKCPFCQTERKIKKEIDRALVLVMPRRRKARKQSN